MIQILFFTIMFFSLSVSDVFSCQGGGGQFMPPGMPQNGMGGYGTNAGGGGCPYQQQAASPYGRGMGMGPGMNSGPAMMVPGLSGAYGGQFPQGSGGFGQYPGFSGQNSAGYGAGSSNDVRCFKVLPNGEMVPIDPNTAADQLAANREAEEKRIAEDSARCLAMAEAAKIKLQADEDAKIIRDAAAQRAAQVVEDSKKDATTLAPNAPVTPAADVVAAATNPNVTKDGVQIITVP